MTERLAHPDSPLEVGGWKQALSAFFNAPFLTTSRVALDVSLKPVNTNLAVDRVVVDKLEPGCYPATLHFGFNLRGRLRFLMDFFLVLLAFAALYALARFWDIFIDLSHVAYQRAVGYERDAIEIFCDKKGKVTRVPYREHVPPDVTAQIFWLKTATRRAGATPGSSSTRSESTLSATSR